MKIGSLVFYKNIKGFTSWVQRVVLGTDISHVSIYIGRDQMGNMMEFEANPYWVDRTTLRLKSPEQMEIYEINLPEKDIKDTLNFLIEELEETKYSYVQWLTTFIRQCFEWLGFDAKGWKILWGWGSTCSEVVYHHLYNLPFDDLGNMLAELLKYNPNTFHNRDIKDIIKKFPELFTRIQ